MESAFFLSRVCARKYLRVNKLKNPKRSDGNWGRVGKNGGNCNETIWAYRRTSKRVLTRARLQQNDRAKGRGLLGKAVGQLPRSDDYHPVRGATGERRICDFGRMQHS